MSNSTRLFPVTFQVTDENRSDVPPCRRYDIARIFHPCAAIAAYLGAATPFSWFHFSTTVYRQFLPKLGFEITCIRPGKYRCVSLEEDEAVWTLVARRR